MIRVARPFVGEEEAAAVREVLLSGNYVSGERVKEFEEGFAAYIGTKHAVAVNSGTAALHLILAAMGLGPGDEVIVPPLTFFATVSSVLHQNAVPVFADVDPGTYCLDPDDFESKITENTRAVVVVHLFGNAASMDRLMDVARKRGIRVVEDCAQAHGTKYRDKTVGSLGDAGAFSFFATKNMTTGEGGMITTDSGELAETARSLRSHGMGDRDTHLLLGYNYRMNEIAAAIGNVQLKRLPGLNERRIKNSLHLIHRLKNVPWLAGPRLRDHVAHTFFWVPFLVDEEMVGCSTKEVAARLRERGVEVRHRYVEPLYRQPVLAELSGYGTRFQCPVKCPLYSGAMSDYSKVELPNAEELAGRLIGLPNHPGLTDEDLAKEVDVVLGLF